MTLVLGIDGGGSNLRVVLADDRLHIQQQGQGGSANPNVVGREASGQAIRTVISEILAAAQLSVDQIAGVGIGIAGASQPDFRDWLQQVLADVMPGAPLAISSDFEIALVGAHSKRLGVLVLAGTGSLAYGVNSKGDSALVGGWGYLLGEPMVAGQARVWRSRYLTCLGLNSREMSCNGCIKATGHECARSPNLRHWCWNMQQAEMQSPTILSPEARANSRWRCARCCIASRWNRCLSPSPAAC
jgi:hypothetical protein